MKTAKVVEVRDLGPLTPIDAAETDQDADRVNRIAELLHLYPHVAEAEKSEILLFLRKAPQAEIDRIGRREGLAPRLMRFRRDHPEHFRLNPGQVAGFVALALALLAVFAWALFG